MSRDFLPRIFQADLHRLYTRVILPTLGSLTLHDDVKTGGIAASMDELLDNAEKHTSNLLAFEARRCFALTLAGVFERQLRIWVRSHIHEAEKAGAATRQFQLLLEEARARQGLDLETKSVGKAIEGCREMAIGRRTVRAFESVFLRTVQSPAAVPRPVNQAAVGASA